MGGASHFASKDDLASDDAFLACLLLVSFSSWPDALVYSLREGH